MNRRSILSTASTFLGSLYTTRTLTAAPQGLTMLQKGDGAFIVQPGSVIQDVVVFENTIYTLTRNGADWQYSLTAFSPSNGTQWSHRLPKALYMSMGIQTAELVTLHAAGYYGDRKHHLLVLNGATGRTSVIGEIEPGPPLRYAGPNRLVRMATGGAVELVETTSDGVQRRRITGLDPKWEMFHVESNGDDTILLIEDQLALCARLYATNGALEMLSLDSPAIASSLAFYANVSRFHPADVKPARPRIVAATGSDAQVVYLLLSPYKSSGEANILSFRAGAPSTNQLTQVVVPNRFGFGIPIKICPTTDGVALLFSSGQFRAYPRA